jgi:hypothetical protein
LITIFIKPAKANSLFSIFQAILHHCPELFNGCKIVLRFGEENKSSSILLECLSELAKAKPVEISVTQHVDQVQKWLSLYIEIHLDIRFLAPPDFPELQSG